MPALSAHAQTLARPGWAGSGLAPEAWYQHAVFYRVESSADMPTEAQLPSLQAFGIDALLLTADDLRASENPTAGAFSIDDLLFECSRLHIRVFVPLDLARPSADVLALAKSWLYRGAGGFVLRNLPAAPQPGDGPQNAQRSDAKPDGNVHSLHLSKGNTDAPIIAALHILLLSFSGSRLLIADGIPLSPSIQLQVLALAPSSTPPLSATHSLFTLGDAPLTPIAATRLLATPYPALFRSTALTPAQLHGVFAATLPNAEPEPLAAAPAAQPTVAPPPSNVYGAYKPYVPKDFTAERRKEAEAKAAREQAEQIAADTFPVQPTYESISATPAARIAFYHRLIQLHRAKTTNAGTTLVPLVAAAPAIAWAVHRAGVPDIVVVCNTTDAPQRVALDTHQTLRTLLHTAAASGVENTGSLQVGAQGVYVGQALGR